ncbi:MAG: redoxin domain-containing protein [Bdellovibrionales bacterium]|nr:redoxin domain-containing protein [Bdellovibrionales bacterium]
MGQSLSGHQHKVNILTLNRLKIYDEKNEPVLISSLWKEGPAVLVFIRHFGCISCRGHIDQVWNMREAIQKTGTKIFFIGSGSPYLISQFKKDHNISGAQIFTDPSLSTFKASGLIHTNTAELDSNSIRAIKDLEAKGYSLKIIENDGDDTQLGGVVSIKPPGQVTYHFISEYIGDFDQPSDWK